jgi:hypothetical protein
MTQRVGSKARAARSALSASIWSGRSWRCLKNGFYSVLISTANPGFKVLLAQGHDNAGDEESLE